MVVTNPATLLPVPKSSPCLSVAKDFLASVSPCLTIIVNGDPLITETLEALLNRLTSTVYSVSPLFFFVM